MVSERGCCDFANNSGLAYSASKATRVSAASFNYATDGLYSNLVGITIYGCIRWGHSIYWDGAAFQYKRFLVGSAFGDVITGDSVVTFPAAGDIGLPPPIDLWGTIKNSLATHRFE